MIPTNPKRSTGLRAPCALGKLALATVLLASACGEGDSGPDADATSPIDQYLGLDVNEELQAELKQRTDALTVSCMADQGFKWVPVPADDIDAYVDDESETPQFGSREYAEVYGFGLSTEAFPQSAVGPGLVGYDDSVEPFDDAPTSAPDPNEEYISGLDDVQRGAYYTALYGDFVGPETTEGMTDEEAEDAWDALLESANRGCLEEANQEAGGGRAEAFYSAFGEDLDLAYSRLASDPRIIEFERDQASCLTGKGYSFVDVAGAESAINERLIPLLDDGESGLALTESQRDALSDLQQQEITIALDVIDCGGGINAEEELYDEVIADLEQEFVENNQSRLDAFDDEFGQG